ncbi:MAG: hypothetical protein ACO1OB_06175 [Archangium sp.]
MTYAKTWNESASAVSGAAAQADNASTEAVTKALRRRAGSATSIPIDPFDDGDP